MKKLGLVVLATLMIAAFTLPAAAVEHEFGGWWRTDFYYYEDFDCQEDGGWEDKEAWTQTRLYYTAKINDNLTFVNKFEFDDRWGGDDYGDVGTDGIDIEVKNSYIDAKALGGQWKIGAQYFDLAREILFSADAIGLKAIYRAGEGVILPFVWIRSHEGLHVGDNNEQDVDMLIFAPKIYFSKEMSINPYIAYIQSQEGYLLHLDALPSGTTPVAYETKFDNVDAYAIGMDFDANFDAFSFWATAIMEFGGASMDLFLDMDGDGIPETKQDVDDDLDLEAYALLIGASGSFGNVTVTGEAGLASGDDPGTDEYEGFYAPDGWYGFGENTAGAIYGWNTIFTGGEYTNLWFASLKCDVKLSDTMSLSGMMSYVGIEEAENYDDESDVGLDFGVKFSWEVIEGLSWNFYGAYMAVGDGGVIYEGGDVDDAADPWGVATRLSVSF